MKGNPASRDARRGLLLVMIDIDPSHEHEFTEWYNKEHLPERVNCPGFLSGRRFEAIEGSPKYLAIYDLETPSVLESDAYKKIAVPSPWTRRIDGFITREIRNVYLEITPEELGHLAHGTSRRE